jgi:putative thiamine transport system substrate-binding protein
MEAAAAPAFKRRVGGRAGEPGEPAPGKDNDPIAGLALTRRSPAPYCDRSPGAGEASMAASCREGRFRVAFARIAGLGLVLLLTATGAGPTAALDWDAVLAKARGETVYWNAWGGSETVNRYIGWVAGEVQARYGITLVEVKLADTAEAVARVLAEKTAGRSSGGSVDLVWINGENFAAMKRAGLLFGPFAEALPNFKYVDIERKPTTLRDFTLPTDGYESPWGMAQLVFYCESQRVPDPPRTIAALLDWAKANPGRFTYPAPPDFLGTTFLKQALYALAPDPARLLVPATDTDFAAVTAPLWDYLDRLHPYLWHEGHAFPQRGPALRQLLDDGELEIGFTFNPGEPSADIAEGKLPVTVRSFVLESGTIGNTHFVAIPFNANAKEAAMVVADFLLSPEAQLRKQDEAVWGDPTVLAMAKLDPAMRERFAGLARGPATLAPDALGPVLPEPDPSWVSRLESAWLERYGK